MTGKIFNIQRYCVGDGPGIRTTVFFKGCPLDCAWCHNPESKSMKTQLFYRAEKCMLCGACQAACPVGCHRMEEDRHVYEANECSGCGNCAAVCATGALEKVGREVTAREVLEEVLRDRIFYESSGGGMTLSGGEPMLQWEFACELLELAKGQGLHTCMETCGFASEEAYRRVRKYTDIFLYDYKMTDGRMHEAYTGVSNERILKNLELLDGLGADIVLRCPIIPTLNDCEEHFLGIADTANRFCRILRVEIEPYHPLGRDKAAMLGKEYRLAELDFPEKETVEGWIRRVQSMARVEVRRG